MLHQTATHARRLQRMLIAARHWLTHPHQHPHLQQLLAAALLQPAAATATAAAATAAHTPGTAVAGCQQQQQWA
jgi:hypothetical protein